MGTKRRSDLMMDAQAIFCERAKPCSSPACTTCRLPELRWKVRYRLYAMAPRSSEGYTHESSGRPMDLDRA